MKALFVCTGNSCRSVMAQFIFNKLAAERGLAGWEARSCGLAAERDFPVPGGVLKALGRLGIERPEHTPQPAARALLEWADLVLPMTRGHREALLAVYPEFSAKIRLFAEHAGLGARDIEDPIGQPDHIYLACCATLEDGIRRILDRHAAEKPQTPRP